MNLHEIIHVDCFSMVTFKRLSSGVDRIFMDLISIHHAATFDANATINSLYC